MTHTKTSLILARGARCEVCKCSRWKGCSIVTALVMARKDRMNKAYTDENAILVCRMCFYTHGYNKRHRRTKAEVASAKLNNAIAALQIVKPEKTQAEQYFSRGQE